MKRMLLSLLAVSAAACGPRGEPVAPAAASQVVQHGDTATLHHGGSVRLGDTGVVLTFAAVEADSRCPTDVTCVWAGDAHVRIDVSGAGPERRVDLHSGLEPREAEIAGFRIRLIDVAPQRTQNDDVEPRDYSVRLAISRG